MTYFDPPTWLFWLLLVISVIVAVYLTRRELGRNYLIAWEVYDSLCDLLRKLSQTELEIERNDIHSQIERERGKLPDREMDTIINLFLEAEAERAKYGVNPYSDEAQYMLRLTNERMRNYIKDKYGNRELEVNPRWL